MSVRDLIKLAFNAKEYAYSPYSNFKVGAALVAGNDVVYTGCNIENAAYTPTNCAERTAFFKAVSEGVYDFKRIVVVGGNNELCYPCGVCRQVMQEFCDENEFEIIVAKDEENYEVYKLKDLLPKGFKLE
ncbi:MAG TPA: cytidine deaminase [Clostridiaceae bacterium]|jgi:cytidine deaminase|nr:cytidine deaminase [Clostridiaceae bacterium]